MHQYIIDTKYCTTELIKIIYKENNLYVTACKKRDLLLKKSDFTPLSINRIRENSSKFTLTAFGKF